MHPLLADALTLFNLVLAAYFIVGNGTYTLLMLLSLVSVWLHNRRLNYGSIEHLRESPITPPVTIIMPAWNEQEIIVECVKSVLQTDYPGIQVCVVDDGSTDETLDRLIAAFKLVPTPLIARPRLATRPVRAFYRSRKIPNLLVISKENGGKPDALNAGLNMCRTPYFCTLDADCILDRNALLRLMEPVISSPDLIAISGGIVRVLNGSTVSNGQVVRVDLPRTGLERFQVVEYLRSFLFGRTGWDLLDGTLIVSGAFAVYHRETVIEVQGFSADTVSEDIELVIRLRRWAVRQKLPIKTSFTSDPVCWTECPDSLRMLARQRRRWQLGLCQTLWKNSEVFFNPAFGVIGLFSFPFQAFVEAFGALVEPMGYLVIPLAAYFDPSLLTFLVPFVVVSLLYAGFLSFGAIVLEELTHRRYPGARHLTILFFYALIENFGYRQLVLWFRFQGVVRFLTGFHKWEKVVHVAASEQATT